MINGFWLAFYEIEEVILVCHFLKNCAFILIATQLYLESEKDFL